MYKNDYDHFHVVPRFGKSDLSSRTEVSLESDFLGLYPIFSSPMKGVSCPELVIEMGKNKCFGILHRFDTLENRKESIWEVQQSGVRFGVAIGANNFVNEEYEIAKFAVEHGADVLCCDIAPGYLSVLETVGSILRQEFPEVKLMAGNVITRDGSEFLSEWYDFIRLGIGNGSNCSTRKVSGIGRNTLVALNDCYDIPGLICDGGLTEPGYVVKAFSAGADFVMLGSPIANSLEADNDGTLFGMASLRNHLETGKEVKSIEGYETILEGDRRPLKDILDEYIWGIRSACTILGAWSYKEIEERSFLESIDGSFRLEKKEME